MAAGRGDRGRKECRRSSQESERERVGGREGGRERERERVCVPPARRRVWPRPRAQTDGPREKERTAARSPSFSFYSLSSAEQTKTSRGRDPRCPGFLSTSPALALPLAPVPATAVAACLASSSSFFPGFCPLLLSHSLSLSPQTLLFSLLRPDFLWRINHSSPRAPLADTAAFTWTARFSTFTPAHHPPPPTHQPPSPTSATASTHNNSIALFSQLLAFADALVAAPFSSFEYYVLFLPYPHASLNAMIKHCAVTTPSP
jgi:hypothetical protein